MSFFSMSQYGLGVSSASQELVACVQQIHNHTEDAIFFSWKAIVRHDLIEAYQNCNEQDWNGYDATPITAQTMLAGMTLLELLPDCMMPEVVPEPTGKIGFLWEKSPSASFVIAVNSDSIAFAESIGSRKRHGETIFLSTLPDDIEKTLLDYFRRM
jgi:hypothetical protein